MNENVEIINSKIREKRLPSIRITERNELFK